jgi:hypothetical protein
VSAHEKGEWQVRIPQAVLTVTVISAGTAACALRINPHSAAFTLTFTPWPTDAVLKCPVTALPAAGELFARDVRVTTRMGRTVRYLIPVFIPSGEIS